MEKTPLDYWPGFFLWCLLITTGVLSALWLEGREPGRLLRWDLLRLAGLGLLLFMGHSAAVDARLLFWGEIYGALNLAFLVGLQYSRGGPEPLPAG